MIAQRIEAGGHCGRFDPGLAHDPGVGLMSFLPGLADRLTIPVVAAGGIEDGRGRSARLPDGRKIWAVRR